MSLTASAKDFGAGVAALFRRYAEWLVSITWKRFVVLSLLLIIMAAILGEIPPFSWPIGQTTAHGVRISIESDQDAAKPQSLREEIAQEIRDELGAEGDVISKVKSISVGDFLPQLAFFFVVFSAALKIAYAGRVKAEARAADESLKRQVVEAKMAAMQAQVEPHFLFNTLASIDHLIETDPPRASKMQKSLIALLRASMPAMREKTTNLGRELDVVRPYLDILQVRMEECLHAQIHVPEGLRSADFPPMMLQSLVENAVKHGLEPKANGGSLIVSAEVVHGKLAVTVVDTGVGFARAATAGTGTGLNNIRERLKLIYGDAAELRITDNTPVGTRVSIVVPYKVT